MQEPANVVQASRSSRLTVEISEELHRKAKSKSALEGGSLASVVRGLLADWVGLAEPEVGRGDAREYAGSTSVKQAPAASGSASPTRANPRTFEVDGGTATDVSPLFAPVAQSKRVERCELRNPVVPSQKCRLEQGHAGAHSFS